MNFYFLTFVALLVLVTTKNTLKLSYSVFVSLLLIIIIMMVIYRIKFESFLNPSSKFLKKVTDLIDEHEEDKKQTDVMKKKIKEAYNRLP